MSSPAAAAKVLPREVQANIDEAMKGCDEKITFKKGFLTRRDINGDGQSDFILDYGRFRCGDSVALYCGSAGCTTVVFASLADSRFVKVLDSNVQGLSFSTEGGLATMKVRLHGSSCGKSGVEPCSSTTYWNGSNFGSAH